MLLVFFFFFSGIAIQAMLSPEGTQHSRCHHGAPRGTASHSLGASALTFSRQQHLASRLAADRRGDAAKLLKPGPARKGWEQRPELPAAENTFLEF